MPSNYELIYAKSASDFLRAIDKGESQHIRKILNMRLTTAPKDYGSHLKGKKYRGIWKIRTWRWRVFYEINENIHRVEVLLIDSRDESTYKRIERKLT